MECLPQSNYVTYPSPPIVTCVCVYVCVCVHVCASMCVITLEIYSSRKFIILVIKKCFLNEAWKF